MTDNRQRAAETVIAAARLLDALGVPADAGTEVVETAVAALDAAEARKDAEWRAKVEALAEPDADYSAEFRAGYEFAVGRMRRALREP